MGLVTKDKNASKKQTDNTTGEIQIECKMRIRQKSQVLSVWWILWRRPYWCKWGSDCDEKDEYVTQEVTPANKQTNSWRYLTSLKAQRTKCLKMDIVLERNMTIPQGVEKAFTLEVIWGEEKTKVLLKLLLISLYKGIKHFHSRCF